MTDLPDEIWHHIFAQLEDYMPLKNWITYGSELKHEGPAALRNVSLVSRRFQRIAQPLLYRTILLEGREREDIYQASLLRTLVKDPQFGEQVRIASFDDNPAYTWDFNKTVVNGGIRKLMLEGVETLDLPSALRGHLGKSLASYQASFAALHVAYMPQLRFLDCTLRDDRSPLPWILSGSQGLEEKILGSRKIDSDVDVGSVGLGDVDNGDDKQLQSIPKDTFANFGLQHLTEVRIRTGSSEDGITPAWVIEPILLHPTLKRLRTLGIDWSTGEIKHLKWPNHESNLEYLDLTESIIDAAGLKSVLTRCPKLKGVSIEFANDRRESRPEHDNWVVDLDHFRDALKHHGRGLEEFDLHATNGSGHHRVRYGRLGPLRELSKLRHLKVTQAELIDHRSLNRKENYLTLSEALPLSLETLYLHWDGRYLGVLYYKDRRQVMNEAVHSFMLENKHPNLREITFEWHYNKTEKEIGWPVDPKVDGWAVDVHNEHLWKRYHNTGYMRTIIRFSKKL